MRKIVFAAATAVVLSSGAAMANDVLDAILASDTYAGATINETGVGPFGIRVEAVLADGTRVENRYRLDGTLRKSETVKDGVTTETRYDSTGAVISTSTDTGDAAASSGDDDHEDHAGGSQDDSEHSSESDDGGDGGSDD